MKIKNIEKNNKEGKIVIAVGIILFTFLVILALITFIIGFKIYKFAKERIDNIQYEEIDKTDLDVTVEKEELSKIKQIKTIVLIGSDSKDVNDIYAGRSDSIIIASINPTNYSIKLLSIPRDTYVNIEEHGMDKINHSYAFGREQLLIKTINSNFGLDVTDYITIDFWGLIDIVNSIGGIELTITEEEMYVANIYLYEIYELEGKQYEPMTEYGAVTLNGEQALAHSRDRYVGDEFTRESRHRQIIEAIIAKVSTFTSNEKVKFLDNALKLVKTNVSIGEYLPEITGLLLNLDSYKQNVISAQVPSMNAGYPDRINNIYYYVVDFEKVKAEFEEYIYEK